MNTDARPIEADDFAYTKQFFTITREGHGRPAPEFGAPTLVWHVAFWPRQEFDPQNIDAAGLSGIGRRPADFRELEIGLRRDYARRRQELIDDFNRLLRDLQTLGRPRRRRADGSFERPHIEQFELKPPADWFGPAKQWHEPTFDGSPLPIFSTDSIGFTLWWHRRSDQALADRAEKSPGSDDLRVRVQADVHPDYSTVTFYIDAGKPWKERPLYSDTILPIDVWQKSEDRRARILSAVADIKRICEARANGPLVREGVTPEPDPVPGFESDAATLKAYADYLYEDIWREFRTDFGVSLQRIAGATDKVFANFRGLVLSTRGLGDPLDPGPTATPGSEPLHRFKETEANAVLKGFWPFFRRIRSEADYRDWVACGVFDWRALYVSSLGSQSEFEDLDEGDVGFDVPAGAATLPRRQVRGLDPANEPDWTDKGLQEAPTTPQNDRPAPFRYLFLTKYEPHRKQIGRLVERINALGTMRLYALKNWSVIRDADAQIRIYGQELDASMAAWTSNVVEVNSEFEAMRAQIVIDQGKQLTSFLASKRRDLPARQFVAIEAAVQQFPNNPLAALRELADITDKELTEALRAQRQEGRSWAFDLKQLVYELDKRWRHLNADWDQRLAEENQLAESRLIAIGVGLDRLGRGAIGGIHYRLNRARYYANVFRTLSQTLRVGLIETWISYWQFCTRGLEPAFAFIESVATRLANLRERLHGEMQSIQTSAIVNQTEATRDNTVQLENVLREVRQIVLIGEQIVISNQERERWSNEIFNSLRVRLLRRQTRWAIIFAALGAAFVVAGKLLIDYWRTG